MYWIHPSIHPSQYHLPRLASFSQALWQRSFTSPIKLILLPGEAGDCTGTSCMQSRGCSIELQPLPKSLSCRCDTKGCLFLKAAKIGFMWCFCISTAGSIPYPPPILIVLCFFKLRATYCFFGLYILKAEIAWSLEFQRPNSGAYPQS